MLGSKESEDLLNTTIPPWEWECWKPLFRVCATLSLASPPQQAGALHATPVPGGLHQLHHTQRGWWNAVEYFYGADLDNSVDSPSAFSFSLMFQTTHGVRPHAPLDLATQPRIEKILFLDIYIRILHFAAHVSLKLIFYDINNTFHIRIHTYLHSIFLQSTHITHHISPLKWDDSIRTQSTK